MQDLLLKNWSTNYNYPWLLITVVRKEEIIVCKWKEVENYCTNSFICFLHNCILYIDSEFFSSKIIFPENVRVLILYMQKTACAHLSLITCFTFSFVLSFSSFHFQEVSQILSTSTSQLSIFYILFQPKSTTKMLDLAGKQNDSKKKMSELLQIS